MRRFLIALMTLLVASCFASMPITIPTGSATQARTPAGTSTAARPSSRELTKSAVNTVIAQPMQGRVSYVATTGADTNPGTEAQPFRTIGKGASVLGPGDLLYVRAGTFHEQVEVYNSGTADRPITLSAYPGELPIIDGQGVLPIAPDESLFILRGDHITLSGLEIKNIRGIAVQSIGSYNVVRNMKIHHCLHEAIYVGMGGNCSGGFSSTSNIVEDNEVWMTSLVHQGVTDGGVWSGAISVGRCPQYTVVRRNTVHETWGIGIMAYEAYNTTIDRNIVWNNQLEHYYVNNAPYTLVQCNLSYNTPDTTYLYRGVPGVGIAFCDEKPQPASHHVTIINNLVWRGNRGFYFFSQQAGSGLKDFLIANNTFVDSINAGLQIDAGGHQNSLIANNIVSNTSSVPLASVSSGGGLTFSHNLWSRTPPTGVADAGDVVGAPLLAGGNYPNASSFILQPVSPAIDAGVTLADVPGDFDGVPRPRGAGYDIGAYESPFSSRVTDLRVVTALGETSALTVTLRWTAPAGAVTYTLCSSNTVLTQANWDNAPIVAVFPTASAPGSIEWLTTLAEYAGGTLYWALKSQNSAGVWSELSNNAFWPHRDIYLPLIMIGYVSSRVLTFQACNRGKGTSDNWEGISVCTRGY